MKHDTEKMFMEAYEAYADAIFRHCYFRVSDRERAEELAQETFMRAWDYVAKKGNIDYMKPLLYRIANNLVIDEWRKKKSVSLDDMQEGGFDVVGVRAEEITHALDAKALMPYLDKLEPMYRDAVVMRYIDDMSPKDIAETLGIRENAVSVRIHRGLEKLRSLIGTNI
ncbi:MAG: RNA polymerase sigma factor [bacterium]|nr:RNA polymerase sigma factor [bacterium]